LSYGAMAGTVPHFDSRAQRLLHSSENTNARNGRCGRSLDCVPARREGLATNRAPQVQRENDSSLLNRDWRPCSSTIHCVPAEMAGRLSAARAASPHSFCALR